MMTTYMKELFLDIVNMSVTASYVILFTLLIRLILKKVPKIYSYSLWLVVLFRLTIPFSLPSILSMLRPIPVKNGPIQYFSQEINGLQLSRVSVINNSVTNISSEVSKAATSAETVARVKPTEFILLILTSIWLMGAVIMCIHSMISFLRVKKQVSTAVRLYDNIYQSEGIETAFVFGLLKPRIYLPYGLTEAEQTFILKHEQTHMKRLDYLMKPFAYIILCIHWFNPLVWLGFILMCRDMEMSCDESVLKSLGNEIKKDYLQTLLTINLKKKTIMGGLLSFGESAVKTRIKNIVNYKRPTFWGSVFIIIILGLIGYSLVTNPIETNKKQEISSNKVLEVGMKTTTELLESQKRKPVQIDMKQKAVELVQVVYPPHKGLRLEVDSQCLVEGRTCYEVYALSTNDATTTTLEIFAVDVERNTIYLLDRVSGEYELFAVIPYKDEIDYNLAIIMSSPKESSNPGDYIKQHNEEYQDIISMGMDALPYLMSVSEGEGEGLRGTLALMASKEILPSLNMVSSLSPDGTFRIETYGINTNITAGGLYPSKGIRLIDRKANNIVWEMNPGYYRTEFSWSPNGRYVAIYNEARIYSEVLVLDTENINLIEIPSVVDLIESSENTLTLSSNRSDPYFSIGKWISNTLLQIEVAWTGEQDKTHRGYFQFDVQTGLIKEIAIK